MDLFIATTIPIVHIKWLAQVFVFITTLGGIFFIVSASCFLLLWLLWKAKIFESIVFIAGIIFASLVTQFLKLLIARPRPEIASLIREDSFAFPSGHALIAVVFYGFLLFCVIQITKRRWIKNVFKIVVPLLILAIGFSRVYLGVHWTTDVIGGWMIGGVILLGMIRLTTNSKCLISNF